MLTWSIFNSDKRFPPVVPSPSAWPTTPLLPLVRFPLRALSTLLTAVGVATCSDTPPTAVKHSSLGPNGGAAGRVAFEPVFSAAALQIAQHLSDFGLHYDRVRVVLVRPPVDTVKDTTIAFTPTGPDITLNLTVEVRSSDEVFDVGIDYLSAASVLFHGHGRIRSHAPDQPAPAQDQVAIDYVGPGANVARISISPKTITLPTDQAVAFTVSAFDANSNPVSTVPVSWSASDPAVATINSTGSLQAGGRRGNLVVSAVTPTGITDRATVAVVPPPTSIALVAGGGQTGVVGAGLPSPAVVQVNAEDGLGVPGVSVVFAAPPGGRVGSTSIITDASGRASTALTLGTVAGLQVFFASIGELGAAVPETAVPAGPAAIGIVSGNGQSDTVRKTLAPLVVRVTDQFGNPLSGVSVAWARATGGGTLAGSASATNGDGRATMTYTLGSVVGSESVTASVSGVASHATFTFQAIAPAPATIVAVSGNAQTGRVGTALAAPFVVQVADDVGAPVNGATINWLATNGTVAATSSSDANGQSSVVLTLGSRTGQSSATASIANGRQVTFVATAQPGIVAAAIFSGQPANGTAGATLSPVSVTLVDANGNQTTAANRVAISLGSNPSGATLSGTLSRNASNGMTTFNDLKVDKVGSGYTFVASSGNVARTSSPFNVAAAIVPPRFTILAGDAQHAAAGSGVGIPPSVTVTDGNGNPVAGASVTFSPSDGGEVIPATAIVTDPSGIATVTAWILGPHPGPQTLTASSAGLTSVVINATSFAGPPAMLAITTQPATTAESGVALAQQPVIQLLDHSGNPTAGSLSVSVSVSAGASLAGTTSVVADPVTGVASFTDLKIVGTGTVSLTFSAPGVQSATSGPITVSSAPSSDETGAPF
jgi:hypothetical protein